MDDPTLLPVFLKLAGRDVLLVGGGAIAASKLRMLLDAGARVTVVAPDIRPEITDAGVALRRRPFKISDLDGAWFVVAAAPPEVNREVSLAAEGRRIFVNAVDDPRNATAYLGGVLRRDGVTVAISTDGRAPALAGLLREALDDLLPEDLARWIREADIQRQAWKADGTPMTARRPLLLDALNRLYGRDIEPALASVGAEDRTQ